MSLLNRHFMTFGGEPITGRTPTQIIVHGDSLTGQQQTGVEHAYAMFCENVRLSPAANGYHLIEKQLSDGTRIRMEANSGLERVEVWPTGGEEEEYLTFFGIPFDESYVSAPSEDVYFIDKLRSSAAPSTILNRLKLAENYRMFPGNTTETESAPSQPGNQTWYAKRKKRLPIVSWYGPYSRYSLAQAHRSSYANKVWGRSLLVNNLFWQDENTAGLQKYPPIYNADRSSSGSSTFSVPSSGFASPDTVRDYFWLSGKRVKTNISSLGKWIISACVGKRNGTKVIRLVVGSVYPTDVLEVSLSKAQQAAEHGSTLYHATDFTSHAITPNIPTALGVVAGYINWQSQPPYWNSDGNEAMGIIDAYALPGVSEVAYSLYKIVYSDDTEEFSAELIEQSSFSESWNSSTGGRTVSGSLTNTGTLFTHIGNKTASEPKTFSSSITASKVIAADYDGNQPVIVRSNYSETMNNNVAVSYTLTGSESQGASSTLQRTAVCDEHGYSDTSDYTTVPGVWSGSRVFSKSTTINQSVSQSSSLTINGGFVVQRARNYSYNASCSVSINGTGTGSKVVTTIYPNTPTTLFHSGNLEPGIMTAQQVADCTYVYAETHGRTLTTSESSTGSCSDYSIVGDLRSGVLVIHESSITPGGFYTAPPIGYMDAGVGLNESWNVMREGSSSFSASDNGSCTITATARNNPATNSGFTCAGTWSHSVSGNADFGICQNDGELLLAVGYDTSTLDTASRKSAQSAVDRRYSYMAYSPFTASFSGTNTSYPANSIYSANGTGLGGNSAVDTIYFNGVGEIAHSKMTFGYSYDTYNVTGGTLAPSSTNSQPDMIDPWFVDVYGKNAVSPTVTSSSGSYKWRFGSDGIGQFNGAGGYPYYSVASSASSKDGRIVYIGYTSETLIKHAAPNAPYVVKLDLWLVDGRVVVPKKQYPVTGAYKMFSCPVFV